MTKEKDKYAVPALDKAFDVLEYLADNPSPKSKAQIAQGLNRSPNELYRILVNLEQKDILIREPLSGCYRLSLKLYNLSRTISPTDQMRQCAIPIMDDLVAEIGLSCHLSVLHQSQTMVLIHSRSHSAVSLNIAEGALFSTCLSNSGKVLLACSNNQVRDLILQRDDFYLSLGNEAKQALLQTLEEVRGNTELLAISQITSGVTDFACLVGEPNGKVIAVLTASSFQSDFAAAVNTEHIQAKVRQAAKLISQQLTLIHSR